MYDSYRLITLRRQRNVAAAFALTIFGAVTAHARDVDFVQGVAAAKPSIVAIATFQKTRSPATAFFGTGFAVDDGLTIVTNAHVIGPLSEGEKAGTLGVLSGSNDPPEFREAVVSAIDVDHDLAILKITGTPLPALNLGNSETLREGQTLAFTGFPLGMVLGFHRATHRAMVSAISPIVQPAFNSRGMSSKSIRQLQKSAYGVLQLDATAYPGNSGSPLYDPESHTVYGVINMVFVKSLKENAIAQPSGITYAIPGNYIRELLERRKH
jgi:serine protease Do